MRTYGNLPRILASCLLSLLVPARAGAAGVASVGTASSKEPAYSWVQVTSSAPWSARSLHAVAVLNDTVCLSGGAGPPPVGSEVWLSSDGTSWSLATVEPSWQDRWGHSMVGFNNNLWVLGGYSRVSGDVNDVWYSSSGSSWFKATQSAAWSARIWHAACAYDDNIWIMGGLGPRAENLNDVWYSQDGIAWAISTDNAPWSGRYGHSCVVVSDTLWLISGKRYEQDRFTYFRDVWRTSDGVNWTQATAGAPWHGRAAHAALAFDNKLWVLGGGYYEGTWVDEHLVLLNDVWYSSDGATWTELPDTPWSPRSGHAAAVFKGKLWIFGGSTISDNTILDLNDIWYLARPHSADTDRDWAISVREIGRVVGLYNAGAYRCDSTTQDGYAPFQGPHDCGPHDSDYDPEDWSISLSELSRLVTFYNAGGYNADPDTPDGFAPGTSAR